MLHPAADPLWTEPLHWRALGLLFLFYSSFFFNLLGFFSPPLFILSLFMHAVTLFTFHKKKKDIELLTLQTLFLNLTSDPNISNNVVLSLGKSLEKAQKFKEDPQKDHLHKWQGVTTWRQHRMNSGNWCWEPWDRLSPRSYISKSLVTQIYVYFICLTQSKLSWLKHIWIPSLSTPWNAHRHEERLQGYRKQHLVSETIMAQVCLFSIYSDLFCTLSK